MLTQKIYSKRIFNSGFNRWNETTNEIYLFCKREKVNPYIFLAVYYIEGYFRPAWFQFMEYILYKTNILKNPSLGPFQVRLSHFKNKDKKSLTKESLFFINKLIKKSGLNISYNKTNFIKFGYYYNLNKFYGEVMYELFLSLAKVEWKKI